MEGHGRYRLLGTTIDDAAGEAFDKVARFLGLGYPGGPAIDRRGAWRATRRPSPSPGRCSTRATTSRFCGLKTAVVNHVRKHPDVATADVAASFQEAVVDVLVTKARRAAREVGAKGLCLGGGVAANSLLRERVLDACVEDGLHGVPAQPRDVHRQRGHGRRRRLVAAPQPTGPPRLDDGADPNLRLV